MKRETLIRMRPAPLDDSKPTAEGSLPQQHPDDSEPFDFDASTFRKPDGSIDPDAWAREILRQLRSYE
jgi:hypothetical protein